MSIYPKYDTFEYNTTHNVHVIGQFVLMWVGLRGGLVYVRTERSTMASVWHCSCI